MPFERYEILLPLKYNDGTAVEPEKFQATRRELVGQFGALTIVTYLPVCSRGRQQGLYVNLNTLRTARRRQRKFCNRTSALLRHRAFRRPGG